MKWGNRVGLIVLVGAALLALGLIARLFLGLFGHGVEAYGVAEHFLQDCRAGDYGRALVVMSPDMQSRVTADDLELFGEELRQLDSAGAVFEKPALSWASEQGRRATYAVDGVGPLGSFRIEVVLVDAGDAFEVDAVSRRVDLPPFAHRATTGGPTHVYIRQGQRWSVPDDCTSHTVVGDVPASMGEPIVAIEPGTGGPEIRAHRTGEVSWTCLPDGTTIYRFHVTPRSPGGDLRPLQAGAAPTSP